MMLAGSGVWDRDGGDAEPLTASIDSWREAMVDQLDRRYP